MVKNNLIFKQQKGKQATQNCQNINATETAKKHKGKPLDSARNDSRRQRPLIRPPKTNRQGQPKTRKLKYKQVYTASVHKRHVLLWRYCELRVKTVTSWGGAGGGGNN